VLSHSADATGRSSSPRELTPARTSVQRSEENAPLPKALATACCSAAPRPRVLGNHEKKRMARLAALPGAETRSVLITKIRSQPAAVIEASTVGMLAESRAERSLLADVTPIAAMTVSASENASVRAAQSAREVTTTTRDLPSTPVMRSGRERTIAVNAMFSARHTLRMP